VTEETQHTIDSLRQKLTETQRSLLTEIWLYYVINRDWPVRRVLHSRVGKQVVRENLQSLGGSIVWEIEDHQKGNRYQLTLLGVLLTDDGMRTLLVRYLDYLRRLCQTAPEKDQVTSQDVEVALSLDSNRSWLLGQLILLGNFFSRSAQHDKVHWAFSFPDEVEDFPPNGDLTGYLEQRVLQQHRPDTPFSPGERYGYFSSPSTALQDLQLYEGKKETSANSLVDPLKKRYQAFVSSTYEDLKEERQHAIQALLETKCIPSGMELFPAASEEQWDLIKRVIDDCDYYIVIVAGKYGSTRPDGTSYTEMEFDYAAETGKPILGFYHNNIKRLPGEKLEETDEMRERLAAFTEKVKKQRMCRPWGTPEGLASAIKSAILHQIEYKPQPGWIRADLVPSLIQAAMFKQRTAELGKPPRRVTPQPFPSDNEEVEIPAIIRFSQADNPQETNWRLHEKRTFKHTFKHTWKWLFLLLAPRIQKKEKYSRQGSIQALKMKLVEEVEPVVRNQTTKHLIEYTCSVDGEVVERILQRFLHEGFFEKVPPPKDAMVLRYSYWGITQKGIRKLAELQAIGSSQDETP